MSKRKEMNKNKDYLKMFIDRCYETKQEFSLTFPDTGSCIEIVNGDITFTTNTRLGTRSAYDWLMAAQEDGVKDLLANKMFEIDFRKHSPETLRLALDLFRE